jgi:hypothetical protein
LIKDGDKLKKSDYQSENSLNDIVNNERNISNYQEDDENEVDDDATIATNLLLDDH